MYWNAYRQRWVLIAAQQGGKSWYLGEVYYAESTAPTGPWRRAVKIATHNRYSFCCPTQHPFFDEEAGRFIYFEGTYSHTFSGRQERTPWDLANPQLKAAQE